MWLTRGSVRGRSGRRHGRGGCVRSLRGAECPAPSARRNRAGGAAGRSHAPPLVFPVDYPLRGPRRIIRAPSACLAGFSEPLSEPRSASTTPLNPPASPLPARRRWRASQSAVQRWGGMDPQATSHGGHPVPGVSYLGGDDRFGEAERSGLRQPALSAGIRRSSPASPTSPIATTR